MPRSCRPCRARTKGKVERPIRYLRENFFYARTFINDADLNEQAARGLSCASFMNCGTCRRLSAMMAIAEREAALGIAILIGAFRSTDWQ